MAWKFRYQQPCIACQQGTNETCDSCDRPFCGHGACLFETGRQLTFPPDPRDEYPQEWSKPEELCLVCYIKSEGHPPFSIWAETSRHSTLAFNLLQKGTIIPTGDAHSWYSPPTAGKMLRLRWGDKLIELDTFEVVQLMNFLQAHEKVIRDQAKATADILILESHKQTDAALRADAGCIDYSQYE
jgi:hypothetical protein